MSSILFLRTSLRSTCRHRHCRTALPPSMRISRECARNVEEFERHTDGSTSNFKVTWNSTWSISVAGFLTLSSVSLMVPAISASNEEAMKEDIIESQQITKSKPKVIFVLGGPGSGKGTQCTKISDTYGFTHLSAGDLLRDEIKSGSEYGTMIANTIKEGKIVPSEVTVRLLRNAMQDSGNDKFLIDGFPRNDENRAAFERVTGIEPVFVLFFDCSEAEMERRLLSRNQGRTDDNVDTIRKRFKVFKESSLPVVQYYERQGKVQKVDASKEVEDVFHSLKHLFRPFVEEDLVVATKDLLQCIDAGDYEVYKRLCDPALTAFEPEAQGHLVEGLEFHKFYFDAKGRHSNASATSSDNVVRSDISSPKVTLLGDDVALVTYTRLRQSIHGATSVEACNETRVWQRKRDGRGVNVWKHVHFHRSKAPA